MKAENVKKKKRMGLDVSELESFGELDSLKCVSWLFKD